MADITTETVTDKTVTDKTVTDKTVAGEAVTDETWIDPALRETLEKRGLEMKQEGRGKSARFVSEEGAGVQINVSIENIEVADRQEKERDSESGGQYLMNTNVISREHTGMNADDSGVIGRVEAEVGSRVVPASRAAEVASGDVERARPLAEAQAEKEREERAWMQGDAPREAGSHVQRASATLTLQRGSHRDHQRWTVYSSEAPGEDQKPIEGGIERALRTAEERFGAPARAVLNTKSAGPAEFRLEKMSSGRAVPMAVVSTQRGRNRGNIGVWRDPDFDKVFTDVLDENGVSERAIDREGIEKASNLRGLRKGEALDKIRQVGDVLHAYKRSKGVGPASAQETQEANQEKSVQEKSAAAFGPSNKPPERKQQEVGR